ncbi:hypothetical protein Fcan01_20309 [Folsomia candida]|uniref:Uncharacterized protein n=1 Tax=Folsomia candida TaxID=158441 RepID=A0A226DL80_FOLCA|nr:hypothetical protein Fcan01_20309 [Folsomia candida]
MVVTSLMWNSLDRFYRYFGIFWKNPLEWDMKTQTLVFTPISRKLIPWMLYGFTHLELTKVVIILCWSGGGGRTIQQKHTTFFDLKGIMLNLIIIVLYSQTFSIYFFAIISSNLNPYSQLYFLFISKGWRFPLLAKFVIFFLRLTLIIPTYQFCRMSCIIISFPVMAAYMALECILTLSKTGVYYMSSRNRVIVDKYLRGYASLQLIFKISDEYLTPSVAVVMFTTMWLSVLFNFISLNMYGLIPHSVFPGFLGAALFVGGCVRLLLPLLVDLYEECLVLQAKWRCFLRGSRDKKYLKRKLRSLRSVAVYGGILGYNLYKCKRSTEMTFVGAIITYTISASLSFKSKHVHYIWNIN